MTGELAVLSRAELDDIVETAVRRVIADQATTPEWVTTKQAAALLGRHVKTVARMAKTGELAATRLGNAWRFRRDGLEKFLAGGT